MKSTKKHASIAILICFFLFGPQTVFAYSPGAPSVYSFNPAIGLNGGYVSISSGYPGFGTHEGAVYLDGNIVDNSSWKDDKIVIQIPIAISAGMHNVTVRNSIGELSQIKQIRTQPAPEIFNITPDKIYPGLSRMCVIGNAFGVREDNWKEGVSDLIVGSVSITSASWTNNKICFTAPESTSPVVKLSIVGTSVSKSFSFAPHPSTNDTLISKQYYLDVVGAEGGWGISLANPAVVVAVIDDGIYLNHPDLKNNIWENKKEILGNKADDDKNGYVDDVYGWNFIDASGEMTVKGVHGTHVAGIIGAESNNGLGVAGISRNTKLMSLIACDKSGCNREAVIKAMKYAADNGANVINLSLGSRGTMGYSVEYDAAVRYAYNKGVVIVAAAGNGDIESAESIGGDLKNIPQSPVCNDLSLNAVLGVSGIDDQQNVLRWANYGTCADVYAPGIEILSTGVPILEDGAFYSSMGGTSFSAPIVAGLAALIKANFPKITNKEIVDRIIQTASNKSGVKTIDVSRAVTAPYIPSNDSPFIPSPSGEEPPQKSLPITKVETTKPKVHVEPPVILVSSTPVFSYDMKLATSTPITNMTVVSSATLRSCPSKTCDVKGIYPNESLFIVREKYGSKDVWYRGEMPDGNSGWLPSELLTLASTPTASRVSDNQSSTTIENTTQVPPYAPHINKEKGMWTKFFGWLKFKYGL